MITYGINTITYNICYASAYLIDIFVLYYVYICIGIFAICTMYLFLILYCKDYYHMLLQNII